MLYLIGQIIFCLLLSAIIGFLLGWFLRARFLSKVRDESDVTLPRESVLEPAPARPKKIADTSPKVASKKDDLKKISGIGPVLEKRLNRLGIYTFDQIAKFSDQDIIKYSEQIGAFPDRIARDDWVTQAAKLRNKS